MRKYLIPAVAAAAVFASTAAFAAQSSSNFQSRITIQTSCVVAAGDVDFGNVGVINGTETATSAVNVNCSAGTAWNLSFDAGGLNTTLASAMTNVNGQDVAYNAFLTGTSGTGPASVSINASLPVQSTPAAGVTYTDSQTVYVTY